MIQACSVIRRFSASLLNRQHNSHLLNWVDSWQQSTGQGVISYKGYSGTYHLTFE